MTDDQWKELKRLIEEIKLLSTARGEMDDTRLRAVAQAVTRLADGLSSAERARREDRDDIQSALVSVLSVSGESLSILREELGKLPAEKLAEILPHSMVCEVRNIQYRRGDANKVGAPLPPVPGSEEDTVVTARHRVDGVGGSEDSISFRTHKGEARIEGSIKAKTLAGWLVAAAAVVWNIVHMITHGGK